MTSPYTAFEYEPDVRAQVLGLAEKYGAAAAASISGVAKSTIQRWQRQERGLTYMGTCQSPGCDGAAAEVVQLSTAMETWLTKMCAACAELERQQADLMRGKGDGRQGYFEGRR